MELCFSPPEAAAPSGSWLCAEVCLSLPEFCQVMSPLLFKSPSPLVRLRAKRMTPGVRVAFSYRACYSGFFFISGSWDFLPLPLQQLCVFVMFYLTSPWVWSYRMVAGGRLMFSSVRHDTRIPANYSAREGKNVSHQLVQAYCFEVFCSTTVKLNH